MTRQISNGVKKIIFSAIGIIAFTLLISGTVFAQGMMGNTITSSDGHTAREEAEGKAIWEKLQAKELRCEDLANDDFGALGEYFMGQMAGEQHEAMNNMMIQMIGADGEKQMHIAMGKRMSNCEPSAPMPQNIMDSGMMPMMMNMMMGGGMMGNFTTNPTGWFGWGFGLIFMILFWGFIILAIVALIKWIMYSSKHIIKSKSALDILKERHAEGEIDKKG